MKINKFTLPLSLFAIAMFGACSESLLSDMSSEGVVQVVCSTEGIVNQTQTRAVSNPDADGNEQNFQLPSNLVPSYSDFKLNIRGEYYNSSMDGASATEYDKTWNTMSAFETENPNGVKLEAGAYKREQAKYLNSYHAYVSYGNINEEGVGKPYFAGESVVGMVDNNLDKTPADFNIYPDENKLIYVVARLANSCFSLEVSEWMLKYYSEIELKIHTTGTDATADAEAVPAKVFTFKAKDLLVAGDDSKDIFAYTTPELKADATHTPALIFVKPGQKLKLSGWAVKRQNQTGDANQTGVKVEFAAAEIGDVLVADTHYTIKVDHDTAGGGGLNITFDDTITQVSPDETGANGSEGDGDVELNPDGN